MAAPVLGDDWYCVEVLGGRQRITIVEETHHFLAFHHTKPAYDAAHVAVIPKEHIVSMLELSHDAGLVVEMFALLQQLARAVVDEHGAARVVTNIGAYQDSKHLHWHVVSGDRIVKPVEIPPASNARTWRG